MSKLTTILIFFFGFIFLYPNPYTLTPSFAQEGGFSEAEAQAAITRVCKDKHRPTSNAYSNCLREVANDCLNIIRDPTIPDNPNFPDCVHREAKAVTDQLVQQTQDQRRQRATPTPTASPRSSPTPTPRPSPTPTPPTGPADRDGDGVPDTLDRCRTQPGPPENQGCPQAQTSPRPSPTPGGTVRSPRPSPTVAASPRTGGRDGAGGSRTGTGTRTVSPRPSPSPRASISPRPGRPQSPSRVGRVPSGGTPTQRTQPLSVTRIVFIIGGGRQEAWPGGGPVTVNLSAGVASVGIEVEYSDGQTRPTGISFSPQPAPGGEQPPALSTGTCNPDDSNGNLEYDRLVRCISCNLGQYSCQYDRSQTADIPSALECGNLCPAGSGDITPRCQDENEFDRFVQCIACDQALWACDSDPTIRRQYPANPGQCSSLCVGPGTGTGTSCRDEREFNDFVRCTGCDLALWACDTNSTITLPYPAYPGQCSHLCSRPTDDGGIVPF